jgi:hypothetical protein
MSKQARKEWTGRAMFWSEDLADETAFRNGLMGALVNEEGLLRDTDSERCIDDIVKRGGIFVEVA